MPEEKWFIKTPCVDCPFRRNVKPYLHPSRAEEISEAAWNPYSSFPCHKTVEQEDNDFGDYIVTGGLNLECAGFLTMQIEQGSLCPEGFTPSKEVYLDSEEMVEAYLDEWIKTHPEYDHYL